MKGAINTTILLTVGAVLTGLTVFLGYLVQRADFAAYLSAYILFFGIYLWSVWAQNRLTDRQLLRLGIALRVVLLFSLPNLSDDFYRFLWDGRLLAQGIHPFVHPPVYFMENQAHVPGITPELYRLLNSPRYFTVYPPVCQGVFAVAAFLFPNSISGGVFVLKLFLLCCEVGALRLLGKWPVFFHTEARRHEGPPPVRWYALNPLIILEIVGNCHFEGALIFFLLAGLAALRRGRVYAGAVYWALAAATKLLPLMYLPLVWRWLGWRRGTLFVLTFGGVSALLFAPLLDVQVLRNMGASLDLYFQQFEFNASVYYLLKQAAYLHTEKKLGRTIGPWLALLTAAAVLLFARFKTRPGRPFSALQDALLWVSCIYLLNTTTVHPWYLAVPLALGALTQWRFAVVWSGAVALSYSHYAGGGFAENYLLIALEYLLVCYSLLLSPTK